MVEKASGREEAEELRLDAQQLTLDRLDAIYPAISFANIAHLTTSLDVRLRGLLLDNILHFGEKIFGKQATLSHKLRRIVVDGQEVELLLRDRVGSSKALELFLAERGIDAPRKSKKEGQVDLLSGCGYGRLYHYAPDGFSFDHERLECVCEVTLNTAVSWLSECFRNILGGEENSLARSLYSCIRTIFPSNKLSRNIWLSTYSGERGYYLIDDYGVADGLQSLASRKGNLGISPGRMVSEFFTDVVDFGKANAKFAIQEQSCVDIDLQQSKYVDEKDVLVNAQIGLVGSTSASIYPLKTDGKVLLAALFPTSDKELVLPTLIRYQPRICLIFESRQKKFKELLSHLQSAQASVDAGKIGELAGGFIKAWIG